MEIMPLSPALAPHFMGLNRHWIERWFSMEPLDEALLGDPERYILQGGGEVWFAVKDGTPIGCYALMRVSPARFEFTKFAVSDSAQGTGAGKALLAHAIARAEALGAADIIIYSNTVLERACAMYRKAGWIEEPLSDADRAHYKRVNIKLVRPLH